MEVIDTTAGTVPSITLTNHSQCIIDGHEFITSMKAIIFVASSLSILGALVIILMSYCRVDDRTPGNHDAGIRPIVGGRAGETSSFTGASLDDTDVHSWTPRPDEEQMNSGTGVQYPARLILVCISAADILVAISHIWGVSNNYVTLQHTSISYTRANANVSAAESTECGAQAVLAIFGAISSFLWSDVLAFVAVIMLKSSKSKLLKPRQFVTHRAFVVYNLICWGIPLIVVCVLGGTNAIGFEEGVDVGWCYIHAHYNKKWKRLGWMFFSYELWVSGSMLWILVMVVLFCIILCATRLRERRTGVVETEQHGALLGNDDRGGSDNQRLHGGRCCSGQSCSKPLILITMAASLIAFRVWATSLDFLLFRSITERGDFHCSLANPIILAFAGFGNSSQGFVNLVIFVLFTGECCKVMRNFCTCCCGNNTNVL